jgi:regulator of nucleoside diphosphate kinase
MHSEVKVANLTTGASHVFTLVFRKGTSSGSNKLSILALLGTTILGETAGSGVSWRMPDNAAEFSIDQIIYQLEAAGDFKI